MTATLIEVPETAELAGQRDRLATLVDSLVIETADDYVGAGNLHNNLKTLEDAIHAKTDEPVSLAYKTHVAIKGLQNDLLKPVVEARERVKELMGSWNIEQEKKRKAEEERLRQEAEKQAEEARIAEAERLEAAGDSATAEAILDAPAPPPPPVCLPKETPKVKGVSFRKDWDIEVIDESLVPVEFKQTVVSLVKAKVKQHDGNITIPGIRITPKMV